MSNSLPVRPRPRDGTAANNTHAAIHYIDQYKRELTSILLNGAEIRKALWEGMESPKEIRATLLTQDYRLITALCGYRTWVLNANAQATKKDSQGTRLYVRFGGTPPEGVPKSVARLVAELMTREQSHGEKGLDQLPRGTSVVHIDGNPLNLVRTNIALRLPRADPWSKAKIIRLSNATEMVILSSGYGRNFPGKDPRQSHHLQPVEVNASSVRSSEP